MAILDTVSASIATLSGKVDAHLAADKDATDKLLAANKDLQDQVAALTAQLAASSVTPDQAQAVASSVDAIAAKLP